MITRVDELKKFVEIKCHDDFKLRFTSAKQLHVIVSPGNGRQIEGKHKAWTDGIENWYNFVINDEEQSLKPVGFDLAKHIEGLGLTGWDWRLKATCWVGFDFDSITNHKQGLRDFEIKEIIDNLSKIPWVELRYSKSGKGIHVYVHFNPIIHTKDRNEHGAVARAVLHKLAALTGFDFKDKVDVCGGNMWVWHRHANPNGFTRIKESESLAELIDWQAHIDVIKKKTIRAQTGNEDIDELTNKKNIISLDSQHKNVIHFLQDNGYYWTFDKDRNMLVTHTKALEQAHKELSLKGIFKTIASGKEHLDKNCYVFPLKNGGFVVRRFGKGVQEDSSWELDSGGWTRCYFNVELDLKTAARCFGGQEHPSGAQFFKTADTITMTGHALGLFIELPAMASYCEGKMRENKDGRLVVEISDKEHKLASDPKMASWIKEGSVWKKIFNKQKTIRVDEELFVHDDLVRHLISQTGEDHGWVISSDGQWNFEALQHIKLALESMGVQSHELKQILGSNILKFWKLVNIPFASEYPGNRQWNRNSAMIRFAPSVQIPESLGIKCPHWFMILSHIGKSLDEILPNYSWASENGILCGADYLIAWVASLFQEPTMPLPYLFLYGPQNSGKSIFHEALSELIINGVVRADNALTSKGNFNAELESAVLGVIEETNIGKNPEAANRIKDWVTSREIQIHRKGATPYMIPNALHFIQCSNEIGACPIFKGDTRVQVFYVDAFKTDQHIPKKILLSQLITEAPDFMAYILNYQIPKSPDRLNVPVIETSEKLIIVESNKNSLELFISDKCYHVTGQWMTFDKFYSEFISWMGPTTEVWSKIRVGRTLTLPFIKGRDMSNNQLMVANISFDKDAKEDGRYILNGQKLIKVYKDGENISKPEEDVPPS
jgi:hypothetical protein